MLVYMNPRTNTIANRLSLRAPQRESLDLLSDIADVLERRKGGGDVDFLAGELAKVRELAPTVKDFERSFPSMCFSLATGVGKTRLAGAFVAYLYQEYGIKNFFVLAPNLTIYNKLIEDFGQPNGAKYVFRGLGSLIKEAPNVITGDNYREYTHERLFRSDININVFNISKINSETRKGAKPLIRKMAEVLGQSYFDYLARLDDLVMIMDESHHYRADRGMKVLNELDPIMGLELTATPQVVKGSKTKPFKNVVYEYSLAKAIRDGFVKKPAVTTRKDFDPGKYGDIELDRIKLSDGIHLHEHARTALDLYAREEGVKTVKPFVLVVAKDTTHAAELKTYIQSAEFFGGRYADKVMDIHSNQKGSEKDDNIAQLVNLEKAENTVEIVIHVNMLKEGWDVTNLYTIVPLRASASTTLTEQTIGRGLRLPYGKITGNDEVDRLSIVAHDNFQAIVDEANKPGSIINKDFIIELDPLDMERRTEVVTAPSLAEMRFDLRDREIEAIAQPERRAEAKRENTILRQIHRAIPIMSGQMGSLEDLAKPEVKQAIVASVVQELGYDRSPDMFEVDLAKEVAVAYDIAVPDFQQNFISIPRITITPSLGRRHGFHDFDLDVSSLNQQPVEHEILIREMQSGDVSSLQTSNEGVSNERPKDMVVSVLFDKEEIDYSEQAEQLYKLAGQAVEKYRSYLDEEEVRNVVFMNRRLIGDLIYGQLMENFYLEKEEFGEAEVSTKAFTEIKPHNYKKISDDRIENYKSNVGNAAVLKMKLFTGFSKACHEFYKFDSYTEQLFTQLCEQDEYVETWMRPARDQFRIYYDGQRKRYQPDFVVECTDAIYLVEPKMEKEMTAADVLDKARAALEYCRYATEFTAQSGGKPWRYVLIPHTAIQHNRSVKGLMNEFLYTQES